jgi:hypothetical protein
MLLAALHILLAALYILLAAFNILLAYIKKLIANIIMVLVYKLPYFCFLMKFFMSKVNTMPHLGQLMDSKIYETRNTRASIGKLIGKSHITVFGYTEEPSLHARILWDLSKALDFDFFEHLSICLNLNNSVQSKNEENQKNFTKADQITVLEEKVKDLEKELAIYKEIVLKRG